jgi:hypothetical protein
MRYSVEQSKTYAINLASRISGHPLAELTHLNKYAVVRAIRNEGFDSRFLLSGGISIRVISTTVRAALPLRRSLE